MCDMSGVVCHVSGVTCHMSRVRCQVSGVKCIFFFLQIGRATHWRVCYQGGLPHLVLTALVALNNLKLTVCQFGVILFAVKYREVSHNF